MPTMPDSEAGHILTNLYGASSSISGQARPPPTSQFHPTNVYAQAHPSTKTPPASAFTPVINDSSVRQQPSFAASDHVSAPSKPPDSYIPVAKRSRSRPTKSCEQCRRKKLKCNRELPCSQCLKGGRDGRSCHFEFGPEAVDRRNGRDEEMKRGLKRFRIDAEEPRRSSPQAGISKDERLPAEVLSPSYSPRIDTYGYPQHRPPIASKPQEFSSNFSTYPTPESAPVPATSATPNSTNGARRYPTATLGRIHFRGRGSRFVGNNDRMAMLDHFKDVKTFIFGSFKDPELSGMIHELFAFQKAFYPKHGHCATKVDIPLDQDSLLAEMLQSVPADNVLAKLQEEYIMSWETISRVLHIPTLAKGCVEIIKIKSAGLQTLSPDIQHWNLAQVLCVTAIASRLYDPGDKDAIADKRSEDQISKDLAMVQQWLDGIQGKAQMNVHILETRVLLLIAHHANLLHPLELWRQCGDIVRRAMILGFHQDPENSDNMPKFQKEMRRKLWTSIVEMDMRFSLGAGMPTAISSQLINTAEIINVDDEELTQDMQDYPISKPNTLWTHALPQIALAASVKERLDAINLLGGVVNVQRDAPLILHHARGLEATLRSLPAQFRSSTKAGNVSNKRLHRLFTSIMLDISIRRPLIALYQTVAMSPVSSNYPEAMAGALRNALAILAHLDALDPTVADLSTVKSRDYLNLFHVLCKSDIMHAAMILCYQIRSYNSDAKFPEPIEDGASNDQDHFHEGHTKQSLTRVVENTLRSMIQRIGDFGSDLKEVLPLSVLLQSVRADGTEAERKEMMIKGAERVLLVCRQILPSIQDAVHQNKAHDRIYRGHSPHNGPSPHPATPDWNPPPLENSDVVLNGGVLPVFDELNLMLGDDVLFQNFDLGFSDWDLTQSWV